MANVTTTKPLETPEEIKNFLAGENLPHFVALIGDAPKTTVVQSAARLEGEILKCSQVEPHLSIPMDGAIQLKDIKKVFPISYPEFKAIETLKFLWTHFNEILSAKSRFGECVMLNATFMHAYDARVAKEKIASLNNGQPVVQGGENVTVNLKYPKHILDAANIPDNFSE